MQATTAASWFGYSFRGLTSCVTAPPSLDSTSTPHLSCTMLLRIGFTTIGVPFHPLYEAITAFAPPSRNAMRKGTE